MKHPTLMIQLSTSDGLPYDYPDDWLETVMQIAAMVNSKYKCGIDVIYGSAEKKHMIDLEEAIEND
tara:strand:+ start:411 stop:608 length:198 start_codon:yes stop_codon:yes gene_type:complete